MRTEYVAVCVCVCVHTIGQLTAMCWVLPSRPRVGLIGRERFWLEITGRLGRLIILPVGILVTPGQVVLLASERIQVEQLFELE
jgi:hypothetical protein